MKNVLGIAKRFNIPLHESLNNMNAAVEAQIDSTAPGTNARMLVLREKGAYSTKRHKTLRVNEGYVYLIRETGQNLYKIGKSINPKKRVRSIIGGHPNKADVVHIAWFEDHSYAEQMFLDTFSKTRQNGEWFILEEEDVEFIKSFGQNIEFIENKLSSSEKQSLMPQAQRDEISQEKKGNSYARGHSKLGQNKGRVKSLEETTNIRKTTRGFYSDRMYKITYEDGTETRLHRVDSEKKLGVSDKQLHRIASRMTLGSPNYDESYKMGPKQKGPQNPVHHKLWNKGIVKVEFGDESGSLKEPFYLEHKDTGEITFYESITDGLKKIRCYDGDPISKKVLQKIVRGHIHGDDVEYFPYTLFIKDKD